MSDGDVHDGQGDDGASGEVLRNLPRTRPQRPSARRTHRPAEADGEAAAAAPRTSPPSGAAAPSTASRATTGAKPKPKASAQPKRKAAGTSGRASAPAGAGGATASGGRARTGAATAGRARTGAETAGPAGAATAGRARTGAPSADSRARRSAAGASAPRAPQGFEPDASVGVEPPSVADVLDSAIGTAGDVVAAGLELGGRAVRGALSRLLGG